MHFFIDHVNLPTQLGTLTNADAFGPDPNDPTQVYNVTSRFQLPTERRAFACESGMMILQQSALDASLVNLILKPNSSSNTLAAVKYYIYRGIVKDQLILNGFVVFSVTTDLFDFLKPFNDELNSNPNLDTRQGVLGFDDNTILGNESIESIFDGSHSGNDIYPICVSEGDWIGNFCSNSNNNFIAGFEILLENDRFDSNLDYARAEKHQVEVDLNVLTGLPLRAKREEILNFIDPAAFFGLHIKDGVDYAEYVTNGNVIEKVAIKTSSVPSNSKFLYTKLLSAFLTKSRVYLDIRSEKGYSYNYYQNYKDANDNNYNIEIAYQSTTGTKQDYQTNSWPIIFFDNSQNTSGENNVLRLKLRIDDNTKPILFIRNKSLFFQDASEVGSNSDGTRIEKTKFIYADKILPSGTSTNFDVWSQQLNFAFKNSGAGNTRQNISTYILLNYFRDQYNQNSPIEVPKSERYYDSAFCSIDLKQLGGYAAIVQSVRSSHPIYVREPLNDLDGTGNFGLAMQNGAYWDSNRVLFYAHLQSVNRKGYSEKVFVNTYRRKLDLDNVLYKRSPVYQDTEVLCRTYTIGNNSVPILSVNLFRSKNVVSVATMQCKEHAMFLGLTVNEVATLRSDTQLSNLHDRFIYLEPDQNNPFPSVEGRYFRYSVKIQGMNQNGEFERLSPSAGQIVVYSRDNQFFHSEGFSLIEVATTGQNRIEFHVFQDGCVKITDNKDLSLLDLNSEQIHYVYFEENGTRHDVASMDVLLINKMAKGVNVSNSPIPSGYTLPVIDYTSYNVNADYSYIYPNGDVITIGESGTNDPNYKVKYRPNGKKTFIVHLLELNFSALSLAFTYSGTRRRYCRPEVTAAFIGALVDVGAFSDANITTVPFNMISTGSCFENGTSFPSLEHNNGNAIDTLYHNNNSLLTNTEELARDQAFVDAISKFGATKILRGSPNHYSAGLTIATNGGAIHNTHLHSGNIVLNDCEEEL